MDSLLNIDALLIRRRQIADAVGELSQEIEKLSAEDAEIETALRVLERYGKPTNTGPPPAKKLGPPRPENVPSLFEMTVSVLRDAVNDGKPGLRGREIVAEIGNKFWPGVKPEQVLPPIYGFVKQKRLKKTDQGLFKPPS